MGIVGVEEKDFQNIFDQTHLFGIEKCTSEDGGRKKKAVNFADFKQVILGLLNVILCETLSCFFEQT